MENPLLGLGTSETTLTLPNVDGQFDVGDPGEIGIVREETQGERPKTWAK